MTAREHDLQIALHRMVPPGLPDAAEAMRAGYVPQPRCLLTSLTVWSAPQWDDLKVRLASGTRPKLLCIENAERVLSGSIDEVRRSMCWNSWRASLRSTEQTAWSTQAIDGLIRSRIGGMCVTFQRRVVGGHAPSLMT